MYIVRKGRLSVVSEDGSITFANLTDGAVFGELSVLNIQGNLTSIALLPRAIRLLEQKLFRNYYDVCKNW